MTSRMFHRSFCYFKRAANNYANRLRGNNRKKVFFVFSVAGISTMYRNHNEMNNNRDYSTSSMKCNSLSNYIENMMESEIDKHFHLKQSLIQLSEKIDSKQLLEVFEKMNESNQKITIEFLTEMFNKVGVKNDILIKHVFDMMDKNNDGILEPNEISAVLTLFNTSNDSDSRFKFLFKCLDLDNNGMIDKNELRATLIALLDAQYQIKGISDPLDCPEIFDNITAREFHTVAKYKANRIVRDVFLYADQNHDGVLTKKEFLFWCRRRNKEVRLLEHIFLDAVNYTFV